MTVREMLTLLISSTLFFAGAGGAIGFALGKFLPGYYRGVFSSGQFRDFDPIAVGVGQGVTQGFAGGAAIGVLMIVVLAWYRIKTSSSKSDAA